MQSTGRKMEGGEGELTNWQLFFLVFGVAAVCLAIIVGVRWDDRQMREDREARQPSPTTTSVFDGIPFSVNGKEVGVCSLEISGAEGGRQVPEDLACETTTTTP